MIRNVICLFWVGEFRGRNFTVEDVHRLYESVKAHLNQPFTFYCLTNHKGELGEGINRIDLMYNWPGWWSKMELHRSDLPVGRYLYIDLDTHIVGDLEKVFIYDSPNLVLFKTPYGKTKDKRIVRRYQAGIMSFRPSIGGRFMLDRFVSNPELYMGKYRSDQDLIGDWLPNQPTFPDAWLNKLGNLNMTKETIFVTGQPKGMDFRQFKLEEYV